MRELCLAFGPSGYEEQAARLILEQITGAYDDCRTDKMGNIIAHIGGGGEGYAPIVPKNHDFGTHGRGRIHDKRHSPKGFLKFLCVGGIDPRVMPSRALCSGTRISG